MKNKLLLSTAGLLLSFSALSNPPQQQKQINERLADQRMEETHIPLRPKPVVNAPPKKQTEESEQTIPTMTKEELVQQPGLLVHAMLSALAMGNADNVEFLLPLYQRLDKQYQEPFVIQWAQAMVARNHQDYNGAIKLYRSVLAEFNDIIPLRLQLAITLFENKETEAAKDQFEKLRAESLSAEAQSVINQYLEAIANQDPWSFSGGLTYLNDPNINNAPKAGTRMGNWIPPERESAQGVGFFLDIGKKWTWGNGLFNEFRLNGNGKYYWNNKKYNEYTGRISIGQGFQTAMQNIVLLPFMEQTWYAGGSPISETVKRFSKAGGATLEWQYWLSPKWRLSTTYEYAEQRYNKRKHLNGNYHFIGSNLVYFSSAQQYWFVGANYNRTSTRDKDDSYIRRGLQIGWGQEWKWGLSTRLSLSYARKNYYAPMPIFNITQRNKEYGINTSIWHRALHYKGITPRLTWSYNKVKSNHAFYTYDKHRIFLEFSKQF